MYKNPFNYIGAKYKLLPQILPLFPKDIDTFVDLFGGSGEVTFNTPAKRYIYNEKCSPLVNIFKNLDDSFIDDVDKVIDQYKLSKTNKQGFLDLRDYYNKNLANMTPRENAVKLYCLLSHAFNYQIAFNSKGEYNMPSGAGRSYFSPQMRERLKAYIELVNKTVILFTNFDFLALNLWGFTKPQEAFLYADPPYLVTCGGYERDFFCKWSEDYEKKLYEYLDSLNSDGCRWALSNVLVHKGKTNEILTEWSKKYNIHYLDMDYKNCNYHTKDKSAHSSVEVLITNY